MYRLYYSYVFMYVWFHILLLFTFYPSFCVSSSQYIRQVADIDDPWFLAMFCAKDVATRLVYVIFLCLIILSIFAMLTLGAYVTKKLMQLKLILDFDVICLTKSNIPHAQVTDLKLLGFHELLRKDRAGRLGDGVAAYVVQHLGVLQHL